MLPRIPRQTCAFLLAFFVLGTSGIDAQFRDARLPESGRFWLEFTPELFNWTDQFSAGAPDGSREALSDHFDGSIASRLFPGPDLFLADLNVDAAALGFTPVQTADFSLGDLDFSSLHAQIRRVGIGFELGVLDRLAVGVRAPFTLTDIESAFVFDSTTASVTSATFAFPTGSQFFTDAATSLGSLQALIDGGTLTGSALTDAITLRDDTDLFVTTLEQRSTDGLVVPTAMSGAGAEMAQRFSSFVAQFEALGLTLPALVLPETGTTADFTALFQNSPLAALAPRSSRNALALGEVEVSARFGVIDQITRRASQAEPAVTDDPEAPPAVPDVPAPQGIRLRTAVGVLARIPVKPTSQLTNPIDFLDLPIADGQTDIELALYQDVAFTDWFMVRSAAKYGIQRPDDLVLRVAPPDQPYALESQQAVLRRDLGDYVSLLIRPSIELNRALSFGLEYDYFRLGAPSFAVLGDSATVSDASPLELEGAQTLHRIGVGFLFDVSEARGHREIQADANPIRAPFQFGISLRRAISGSGGLTPASFRFGADFRFPIRIF